MGKVGGTSPFFVKLKTLQDFLFHLNEVDKLS